MCKCLYQIVTIACLLMLPMLTACHSSRHAVDDRDDIYAGGHPGHHSSSSGSSTPSREDEPPADADGLRRALCDYAKKYVGVPYRYGGNDRNGLDCSGLVCRVYLDVAHFKLPRNSAEQGEFCREISKSKLRAGDLLFFTGKRGGRGRVNHVAMYIGHGKMVHASSSRGVIISNIDDDYWAPRLHHCGRVRQLFD